MTRRKGTCHGRKGSRAGILALLLAGAMLAWGAPQVMATESSAYVNVDLDKAVSLTVTSAQTNTGSTLFAEDLKTADVVADLYRVADAVDVEGYDTYTFEAVEPYDTLTGFDVADPDVTSEDWQKMAQVAAAKALDGTQTADVSGKALDEKISDGISSGLYLVVLHGKDMAIADYVKDGDEVQTIARSTYFEYSFEPILISLPTRSDQDPANMDGASNMTSNTDLPWQYDVEIAVKAARERMLSSLMITKSLLTYETKDPATFVFQVEGVVPAVVEQGIEIEKEIRYSNVVSIVFDGAEDKSLVIEDLPVGMEMTVTEVYSGANYKLTTDAAQTATIVPDETAEVTFENDYDDKYKGGGSIRNEFRATNGHWVPSQVKDDADLAE